MTITLEQRIQNTIDEIDRLKADNERLHKIELQFNALKEERVRWHTDNTWLTEDNERLRAALQEIADMRYDNTSAATIARRALEPKP